jgi:hypothetical protein
MFQRTPDPQPPSQPVQDEPSLSIYAGLLITATLLIGFAFILKSNSSVEGLLLNLGTELLGAVIILVIVERRLRNEDILAIRDLAFLFTQDSRIAFRYATVLEQQILNTEPISRPEFDNLLHRHPKGFVLYGVGGSGKSTLVQKLTVNQCAKVKILPRTEKIPIFVLIRAWDMEAPLYEYIRSVAQEYYVIKDKFFNKWLNNGRLMIVFDGLDECKNTRFVLNAIENFCKSYSGNSIIVASRNREEVCGLPVIDISKGMNIRESMALFLSKLSQDSTEAIGEELLSQLAEKLAGHPLLISIVIQFINKSPSPKEATVKILTELNSSP